MALTDNLIAYWKLDESSGNASDSVASHTLTNANVTYSAGKINNGASFNSTTDALSTSTYTDFDFERTSPFSVSFWVKFNNLTGNQFIFTHQLDVGVNPATTGWAISGVSNSGFGIELKIWGDITNSNYIGGYTTLTGFTAGVFSHVVVTYDGSSTANQGIHIYVDNVDKSITYYGTGIAVTMKNSANAVIGNQTLGNEYNADAIIDELGVWSRVLTSGEVTSLYNAGTGLQYPFSTSSSWSIALV